MTSSNSSRIVLALIANIALASTACGVFGGDLDTTVAPGPNTQGSPADNDADSGPKAPPVDGNAATSELTDDLGIFVTMTGNDAAAGTHLAPLSTIQAGIDKAKAVGKRVYVCVGTYKEALTLADSISIIGGLDCAGNAWATGDGRSRVESPTSPAMRAKDITSPTHIEGLDVIAPNASAPSGSSIGLIAEQVSSLVIARSKIASGDASKGDNGVEGLQLANGVTTSGGNGAAPAQCVAGVTCRNLTMGYVPLLPVPGGTNTCVGGAGLVMASGGAGGTSGVYSVHQFAPPLHNTPYFVLYMFNFNSGHAATGGVILTGAQGTDGPDGANAAAMGVFTTDGYTAVDGTAGSDGTGGSGGSGGSGAEPSSPNALGAAVDEDWAGAAGAGGGAGGCPGLAGTAGKGGGASIAALLFDSPITFDGSELASGQGGSGGLGSLGSGALAGGLPGGTGAGAGPASPGGRGGVAGISGNGSNGPSLGIAHKGAAPVITGGTKITLGVGGPTIAARSRTDAVSGMTKTVPATAAGTSQDILPL